MSGPGGTTASAGNPSCDSISGRGIGQLSEARFTRVISTGCGVPSQSSIARVISLADCTQTGSRSTTITNRPDAVTAARLEPDSEGGRSSTTYSANSASAVIKFLTRSGAKSPHSAADCGPNKTFNPGTFLHGHRQAAAS